MLRKLKKIKKIIKGAMRGAKVVLRPLALIFRHNRMFRRMREWVVIIIQVIFRL